jgi:type II secretory pathway component PulF
MSQYTQAFRSREAARTARSLMAAGLPMIDAIELCAEAYELSLGTVLESWGAL